MPDYKKFNRSNGPSRDSRDGGNRSGGMRPRPFTSGGQDRELFDAECNSCHDRCQVPFRPNGKKPVYCAKCFTKDEGRGDSRDARDTRGSRDARDTRGSSTYSTYQQGRPHTSSTSSGPQVSDRQIQDLTKKIEVMNQTLEKLITAVDTFNRATALTKEIRKHFPNTSTEAPADAPKKAAAKAVKKIVKKAAPKSAKESVKAKK